MKLKNIALASAAVLALSTASAFAVTAQTGVFFTGGVGVGQLASPTKGFSGNYSYKDYGTAFQGSVGYQQALNQNFSVGVQIGYSQLGQASYTISGTKVSFKDKGLVALVNANYLWNNGFNVFVNAGGVHLHQYRSASGTTVSLSKNKFMAGAGVGYQMNQNFGINLAYEHLFGTNMSQLTALDATKTMSGSSLMLNFVYTLPTSGM